MSTADALVQATARDGGRRLTLDLRQVTFFDSAAIHAVIRLAERFPSALTVLPSRQVRRVLDISGLGDQEWLAPERTTSPERSPERTTFPEHTAGGPETAAG